MEQGQQGETGADGLKAVLAPVADDLGAVETIFDEALRPPTAHVRPLMEHVKRFQGKMLRPAMTCLAGRCFGEIGTPHHQLGAIVEMIHTATLVHDDVLDAADRRRRTETANRLWGNHAAVLLGDYIFATAFSLSASIENRLASRYLSWIAGMVCQGEILQILQSGNLDLDEETYFEVIEKKTAYLFSAAARMGAEYALAPEDATDALADYGMRLGCAFQIVDDVLDLIGEEARVGKTLGTDARQGKVTLPVIHFLRNQPPERADRLRGLLAGGEGDAHLTEIRAMLEASGSLSYARDTAARLSQEALGLLSVVPESPWRDVLAAIARYTLHRRR